MSAVLCQNFVQNAWKHEFCSNCYRTKHEHRGGSRGALLSSSCLSSTTTWQGLALQHQQQQQKKQEQQKPLVACPPLAGILKSGRKKRPPFHERQVGSVGFHEQSPQVIGYGGDGTYQSDNEEEPEVESTTMNGDKDSSDNGHVDDAVPNGNDADSLDNFDLSMEEKEIARLTFMNTEFNSNLQNLALGDAVAKTNGNANVSGSSTRQHSISVTTSNEFTSQASAAAAAAEVKSVSENCEWEREVAVQTFKKESVESNANQEENKEPIKQQVPEEVVSANNRCNSPTLDPTLVPPPDYLVNDEEVPTPFSSLEETQHHESISSESSGSLPIEQVASPSANEKDVPVDDKQQQPAMHYSSSSILKGVKTVAVDSSPPAIVATSPFSSYSSSSNETSPVTTPTACNAMPHGRGKPKVPTKPINLSLASNAIRNEPQSPVSSASENCQAANLEQDFTHTTLTSDSDKESKSELSFQAKVATIANNLDLNRRNIKRQAPLPPSPQPAEAVHLQPRSTRGMLVLPIAAAHRPLQTWESDPGPSSNPTTPITTAPTSQPARPAPSPSKKSPTLPVNSSLSDPCCGLRTKSPSLDSGGIGMSRFPCLSSTPHDYMKDMKKFKNKFSFKRLLKFGRDGEDGRSRNANGNAHISSNGNVRMKSRIEILHPIDLANMSKRAEENGEDFDSYNFLNGNKFSSHAVIEKQKSLPLSNGFSSNFALSFSSTCLPTSVDDDEYADFAIVKKPFPPPRIKGIVTAGPARPPPPMARSISPCMSSDTDQGDYSYIQPVSGDIPSPQGEYANLGDARTPFVPKKPERNSPASCRRETSITEQSRFTAINANQYEVISSSEENHLPGSKESISRTYYEPAEVGMASTHWETSPVMAKMNILNDQSSKKSKHRMSGKVWATSEDDSGDAGSEGSAENGVHSSLIENVPMSALYAEVRKAKPAVNNALRSSSPNDPLSSSLSEDEPPSTPPAIQCNHRLQLRKGRTVLPRGLHENYGAVVAANHEALAQLLDQISQRRFTLPSGVTTLKDATLRWSDFTLDNINPLGTLEHVSFYAATWNNEVPVTLMVTDELFPAPCSTRNPFIICPIATFQDWVPAPPKNSCLQRGWVGVMEFQKIQPLSVFIQDLRSNIVSDVELFERGAAILLLQFLSSLKHLQADGIEEVADDLSWVLVHKNDPFQFDWRLMMVPLEQATAPRISLCECAVRMVLQLLNDTTQIQMQDVPEMLPNRKAFLGILELLRTEKAMSLSKAKAAVEFFLWGPTGLVNIDTADCQELSFQHWLDLERATTLSNLIRSHNNMNDFVDELHLLFLVRATARTLKDAAVVVTSTASTA